jgi:cell wall-associated NlpC family hydrolase
MRRARIAVPVTSVWRRPDVTRPLDEPVTRPEPDAGEWADGLDLDARHALLGRLDTQALLGEPVLVTAEQDGWAQVRLPWQPSTSALAGYPGWVPAAHLVADAAEQTAAPVDGAVVTARLATAQSDDGARLTLSFGTVLPLVEDAALRHPDGRVLHLDQADVTMPGERAALDPLTLAARFERLPYLWAGLSGHGVDCSGFVHLVNRAIGRIIPRDAHDQALAGAVVAEEDVRGGDAVYFENDGGVHHTGFAVDALRLLHSPRTGKDVRYGSIVEDYPGELHAFRRFD